MLSLAAILVLSYGLGAIPFSLLVAKSRGVDLRAHGSGNAGATNAFRVLGAPFGALVFALDALKGFGATYYVSQLRLGDETLSFLGPDADVWAMVLAGTAAMVGHVVTVWGALFFGGWKGGKGVATGAGMLIALIPIAVLAGLALFVLVVVTTRLVSLASILAATSLPITVAIQRFAFDMPRAAPLWGFVILVPLFILWTHRQNVRRLLDGTEPRVSDSARTA